MIQDVFTGSVDTLSHQLEELSLLRASLLPGESLAFLDDEDSDATDDTHAEPALDAPVSWEQLLLRPSGLSPGSSTSIAAESKPRARSGPPARFAVRASDTGEPAWFEVILPHSYAGTLNAASPIILAKGAHLGRRQQEAWASVVEDLLASEDVQTSQYPVFELFTAHLLPLLHDPPLHLHTTESAASSAATASAVPNVAANDADVLYHALLTSHHLRSPQKRRFLAQTSAEHGLRGFAKVGHPGVIYAAGPRAGVEAFASGVRALTWLALRTRFVEPLPEEFWGRDDGGRAWREFEKVGEVVEYMRGIGREAYVVEMGIGSTGVK